MAGPKNVFLDVLNKLKLVSVEPYLFFCLFSYSARLVSYQSLLIDGACRNWHLYPDEICSDLDEHKYYRESSIQTGNNLYSLATLFASLPAIVVAIFMGPWSDKYSRKYPLIIAASGMMLESVSTAILSFYPKVSPVWFVSTALLAGFSGDFIMGNSAAFSYVSDITDERSRPARYAVLEFSSISAIVLGNILGGEVFKAGGYVPVMVIAPCSLGLAILYTALVVKETKPRAKCSEMIRDLITVQNIKESYKTCSRKRPGNLRLQIWLLVWINCTFRFMDMGMLAIGYAYARGMYQWDVTEFAYANTAFYVVNAFLTVTVVPILTNKLQIHEAALGLVGILSLTAKMVLASVAYYEVLFYYAWISGSLYSCAAIAVRSRLSKLVNKNELGRAFSLLSTCESVTPLLGTLAFVQMYNASVSVFPGLVFAVSAVCLVPCLFIFSWMTGLPTVSLGEYARDDTTNARPLETFSSNYVTLQEDET